jgi:hypothetical protein
MPCSPRRPDQRQGINKEHDDAKDGEGELEKFICRRHFTPPRVGTLVSILSDIPVSGIAIEFGHRGRNGHVVLVVAGFGRPLHAGSGVPRRRGPWSRSPQRPESPALHGYHSVRSRMSS